jgi:hypothetical protein
MLRPFPSLKVYPASSWRNGLYRGVVDALREAGHQPYDWRASNFSWNIAPNFKDWSPADYVVKLRGQAASAQFARDIAAIDACDVLVLITPCGASAHAELAYAHAKGKSTIAMLNEGFELELMHSFADAFVESIDGLLCALAYGVNDQIEGLRCAP